MEAFEEVITFYGHPLIIAAHRTTFELTGESHLTPRGDCIVGVRAEKACRDLSLELKRLLREPQSTVRISLRVEDILFTAHARGHPRLTLTDGRDLVVRRSGYVCPRTLAIHCDKAAADIPRAMVSKLTSAYTQGKMVIEASVGEKYH